MKLLQSEHHFVLESADGMDDCTHATLRVFQPDSSDVCPITRLTHEWKVNLKRPGHMVTPTDHEMLLLHDLLDDGSEFVAFYEHQTLGRVMQIEPYSKLMQAENQ